MSDFYCFTNWLIAKQSTWIIVKIIALFPLSLSLIMSVSRVTPFTILHTSDWHLGRRLYGRRRYDEFEAFLAWLYAAIIGQHVDVLIVAGDIFDTMTPSNRAQALYYEFLGKVSKTHCQHIVIVAGNHDSPTFLDAPSHVLKFLNVHVIGTACEDMTDEVLTLNDASGAPICIVAAVPYLRDRDVRSSCAGESMDSKDANVIQGIRAHYDTVAAIAKTQQRALQAAYDRHIPIIATGHLFAAGSTTTDDDGVRDLYVGNLGKISASMFDKSFDYVALGHLHVPQKVGGVGHIRYSGSPIAMGFGEARQQKQVLLVQFGKGVDEGDKKSVPAPITNITNAKAADLEPTHTTASAKPAPKKKTLQANPFMDDLFGFDEPLTQDEGTIITTGTATPIEPSALATAEICHEQHRDATKQMQILSLPIPKFQPLAQISGDLAAISKTIKSLTNNESIWLEVVYTGDEIISDLRDQVQALVEGLPCEVLKIKNTRIYNKVLNQQQSAESLQDLDEMDVFERCLTIHDVPDLQKHALRDAYGQILHALRHDDTQAE